MAAWELNSILASHVHVGSVISHVHVSDAVAELFLKLWVAVA